MSDATATHGGHPVRPTVWLWVATLALFVVGDLATTAAGLGVAGVVESNPFVGPAVALHGFAAMVVLKLATLLAAAVAWRVVPRPHALGVPVGLATLGLSATLWNVVVVAAAG